MHLLHCIETHTHNSIEKSITVWNRKNFQGREGKKKYKSQNKKKVKKTTTSTTWKNDQFIIIYLSHHSWLPIKQIITRGSKFIYLLLNELKSARAGCTHAHARTMRV